MASYVTIPQLGMSMIKANIIEWKVQEGDWVDEGQGILDIETEKARFDIEAAGSGFLHILIEHGNELSVGRIVGLIARSKEELEAVRRNPPMPMNITEVRETEARGTSANILPKADAEEDRTVPPAEQEERIRISPSARKVAREHAIDITRITGTGPGGRIQKEDVEKVIASRDAPPATAPTLPQQQTIPLSTMRRTIAERMSMSVRTAPHFWVTAEADMTNMINLRQRLLPLVKEKTGTKLTITDLMVKIAANAVKRHPIINSSFSEKGLISWPEIHIGIATEVPGGLVVPVVRNADRKSLSDIVAIREDIVNRSRRGKLNLDEMTGSTFTLNNVGALGIKCINAIVNPPESAILTIGSVTDRAVVVNGQIVVRPMMDLSLAADHRVLDGGSAGRFLQHVKELMETPALLVLQF